MFELNVWRLDLKEDYMISIVGRQTVDGEQDQIELTTIGSYIIKGKSKFIIYKEYDERFPNKKIRSILKVEDDKVVTIIRSGESPTRLMLERGKRHLCYYNTGFGALMIGVFANSIKSDLNINGGTLKVIYDIDFNSDFSSSNELYVKVIPKGQ